MTGPRTEDEAEAGVLTVVMGGQPYKLPALTIADSEEWQAKLGAEIASLDVGIEESDAAAAIGSAMQRGQVAMQRALLNYDLTNVLGGEDKIRKSMTQRELHAAVEVILDAEFPFDTTGRHSVVEAFGLPLRVLGVVSKATEEEASRRARYPSSLSPTGASTTPASAGNGRQSNSLSGGRTGKSASRRKQPTS